MNGTKVPQEDGVWIPAKRRSTLVGIYFPGYF